MRRTDAIIEALAGRHAAGSARRSTTAAEPAEPAPSGQQGLARLISLIGPGGARPGETGERGRPAEAGETAGIGEAAFSGPADPSAEGGDGDPAVRLLRALVDDVGEQVPERAVGTSGGALPGPDPGPGPGSGSRRRGPRTIVALGVVGAVLASTGVAAANGGLMHRSATAPSAARTGEALKAAPEADATETAVRERLPGPPPPPPPPAASAPPSRTPPARHRGEPSRDPARRPDREEIERMKRRLEGLLPPATRARRPGEVSWPGVSPRSRARDGDDMRRRLEGIRRRARP